MASSGVNPSAPPAGNDATAGANDNIMTAVYENPFRLPSDDMVFRMRDEQQKQAAAERKRQENVPVHEKTTSSMKQQAIRRIRNDDIIPGADAALRKKVSETTPSLRRAQLKLTYSHIPRRRTQGEG